MTEVLDSPALVSQPSREITYAARRSKLRLVMKPVYPIFGGDGRKVGEAPGVTIPFREGILRLPTEGVVQAEDGRPVEVAELHAWLQGHRMFGDREEGFFIMEVEAPPISPDELSNLMDAAMMLDVDGLEAIIEQEREGWNRPGIVDVAQAHLEKIREANANAAKAKTK